MPLIKTEKLTKTFKTDDSELEILKDISIEVEGGEFISIVGKSGSGKTTLMNILGCLDYPTTGTYYFEDYDISQADSDKLAHIRNRKIGFIFQTFNLLNDLTALDNVALPQLYAGISEREARIKAREVLNATGLSHRARYYPHQLSGGERQRVSIARAIINAPLLILADEPTGNLDSKTGAQILEIFKHLNNEHHITFIIVTHDNELAQSTERTIVLADGRIIT
ncbi:MAG: ABC transporter ATP-binding protein [Candidatus Babeliaceae bacterium]|nr:ABC transporter ATP-binding protein [Candidatus Babeliaceae bacterium]